MRTAQFSVKVGAKIKSIALKIQRQRCWSKQRGKENFTEQNKDRGKNKHTHTIQETNSTMTKDRPDARTLRGQPEQEQRETMAVSQFRVGILEVRF